MCSHFFTLIVCIMIDKKLNCDVCVVGGGVAGVCAAIASARDGAKTILINSSPVLGGNSSSEIRVWTRGSSGGGNVYSEEMGILGELKLRNLFINKNLSPLFWDEILLEAVINEENISLLLNTLVVSSVFSDNCVKSISAFSTRGEINYFIESKVFIDASGDGIVASSTNIDFVIGKESKDIYNEVLAPVNSSSITQGSSILFFTEVRDNPIEFIAPSFAYPIEKIEKLINCDGRIVNEKTNGLDFWWVEYGGDTNMFESYNDVSFELKRLAYGIFNYIKNSGKYDAANLDLIWVGNLPGKRESRRFITDSVLSYNDIKDKRVFDDVAFYGGWFLDFHPEGGIYSSEDSCTQIPVGIYPIPLSSLYSSKVDNLLLCGRIIGTSHSSFASTRIMDTCALSGQVAGTAAAYLVNNNKVTSDLKCDYPIIQEKLEDIILINKVKDDYNREFSCSSIDSIKEVPGIEDGFISAECDIFLSVDSKAINSCSIVIDSSEDTMIEVRKRCDILPHRFDIGYSDVSIININKGRNIISLDSFSSDSPCFITLAFSANSNIRFPLLSENLPGFLIGHIGTPYYFNPYIILNDFSYASIDNLAHTYNRPYNGYNAWVSDKKNCELSLKAKKVFNHLSIYLDPSLQRELVSSRQLKVNKSHMIDDIFGVAPSLVKDFDIIPYLGDKELETVEIRNNYQRCINVNLAEKCDSLVIKFRETWGDNRISVFSLEIK